MTAETGEPEEGLLDIREVMLLHLGFRRGGDGGTKLESDSLPVALLLLSELLLPLLLV